MSCVPGVVDPDEEIAEIFLGCDYGDPELEAAMRAELRERLATGERLRVYCGYDPTKPDLHLGHSITLRKLRKFQEFGHHVIVVIGTFTALVGDTSDKKDARDPVHREAVERAAATYAEQIFTILDRDRTEVVQNATWLEQLSSADLVELASAFTVQQFLTRTNYKERIEAGRPVPLHEFFYALFQGYDAVHLRADVQIGATEQLFNIMAGRRLQQRRGERGCVPITYPILVGTDGVERMSKSTGNYVGLTEPPSEQYGKVMSISDDTMRQWIPLVSGWSPAEVGRVLAGLDDGSEHPMALKKRLAFSIVEQYHGTAAAEEAERGFEQVFQRRETPDEAPEVVVEPGSTVLDVLLAAGAAKSKSEARRLVAGRGVSIEGEVVDDETAPVDGRTGALLRVGKRRFYRIVGKG